jgi:hypothetical protein
MTGSENSNGYFNRLYSWIEDGNIGKVGLHLNRRGVIGLGHLYSTECTFSSEGQARRNK